MRYRKLLCAMAKTLGRDDRLQVGLVARMPNTDQAPDEVRITVAPKRAKRGLIAIEVGVEQHQGGGGPIAMPVVVVRAIDGSDSYLSLPRSVTWTRGREDNERVAIIRPKLPTRAMCLALVRRVAGILTGQAESKRRPRRGSKSSGGSSSTSKRVPRVAPAM